MSNVDWYKSSLEEYNARTKADVILLDFLHSKADQFKLDTRKRCLSIGPGTGDVDLPLLTSHCTALERYIGIEPNHDEADVLKDKIRKEVDNTDIKVEIITDRVESWSGPDEPVDLILMVHVLYHIPDTKTLFQRCRDWLAPGGVMVIVHGGQNIFLPVAEKFDVKDEMYRAKHIYEDLVNLGFPDVKQEVTYVEFDIRDRNVDLMNMLLLKRANDAELAALDTFLREIMPSGVEQQDAWVIWWTK